MGEPESNRVLKQINGNTFKYVFDYKYKGGQKEA